MPSKRVIEFYDCQSFAILGMSRSPKSIGWSLYDQLSVLGKRVYAINPSAKIVNNVEFFNSLDALPETPEAIIVCTSPGITPKILDSIK